MTIVQHWPTHTEPLLLVKIYDAIEHVNATLFLWNFVISHYVDDCILTLNVWDRINPVLHCKYHGCWCQHPWYSISTHDIDYVEWVSSSHTRERISTTCAMSGWRNAINYNCIFMFSTKNSARKGLVRHTGTCMRSVMKSYGFLLYIAENYPCYFCKCR